MYNTEIFDTSILVLTRINELWPKLIFHYDGIIEIGYYYFKSSNLEYGVICGSYLLLADQLSIHFKNENPFKIKTLNYKIISADNNKIILQQLKSKQAAQINCPGVR